MGPGEAHGRSAPPSNIEARPSEPVSCRNDVLGRYGSNHRLALSGLWFCRRRHRGSDRHGWRFSDDAVADTAFRRPSAHGDGNRLASRRRDEDGWHRIHSKKGNVHWHVAGLLAAGSVPATVLTIWVLSRVPKRSPTTATIISVSMEGTDHRGRGDLFPPPYPRLRLGPR
jgi:hypothetical protein